jgi:RHS repeat-associated protein
MLTRADGSVVEERRYEPFGQPIDAARQSAAGAPMQIGTVDFVAEPHNDLGKETDANTGWSYHGARWMAPELARWLAPDAVAKAPEKHFMVEPWKLNPYQFVEQNPVVFWDPDGNDSTLLNPNGGFSSLSSGQYEVVTRSFAPFDHFGTPHDVFGWYHGDKRSFSTAPDVTARATQATVIDLRAGTLSTRVWADTTLGHGAWATGGVIATGVIPDGMRFGGIGGIITEWSKTAKPTAEASLAGSNGAYGLEQHYAASMPLTSVSPDIDVHSKMMIDTNTPGQLHIAGVMTGDEYPDAEQFIRDSAGHSVFLGVYGTDGGRMGPYTNLWGDRQAPMGNYDMRINLDSSGNFTGVESGGKSYTIDGWNTQFTGYGN